MTIGVFIDWGGVPVLISDVMLTGGTQPRGEALPSFNPFVDQVKIALSDQGHRLRGLVRKMVDVAPGVSYCWAGSSVEASVFHDTFKEFWEQTPSVEELSEFFRTYPRMDSTTLSVIAIAYSGREWTPYFLNAAPFELECGRTVALIGSGVSEMYEYLSAWGETLTSEFRPWDVAMIVSAMFHGISLGGAGFKAGWGGGFEVRCDSGRGFEKFENILSPVYRLTIGRDGTRSVTVVSEYFTTSSGEAAVFYCSGSVIGAWPHHLGKVVDPNGEANGQPQHIVVGFQVEHQGYVGYVEIDPNQAVAGVTGTEANSPLFVLTPEAMHAAFESYKLHFPQRAAQFFGKRTRTKKPDRFRARRRAAAIQRGR